MKTMRRFASLTLLSTLCATLYAQEKQESFSDTPSSTTEEAAAVPINLSAELHSSVPGVPSSASRPYAAYAQPEAQTSGRTSRYVAKGGHRGFDVGVDLGFLANTGKGGGGSFAPEVNAGKRFSKNIYAGVAIGAELPFNGGNTFGLFAADFHFYAPLQNPRFAPGGMLRAGYELGGDYEYVVVQVMPTFQFAISKTVDANVGVGYTEYIGVGDEMTSGNNFGAVVMKVGFGFHMPSDKQVKTRIKPKKPVIENGIQLTFEGDALALGYLDGAGGGFALAATYKYNPHISFGLGFGFDALSGLQNDKGIKDESFVEKLETTEHSYTIGHSSGTYTTTKVVSSETKTSYEELEFDYLNCKRLFLRGAYRVFDKRHSPLVSCDLGVFFQSKRKGEWPTIETEHFRKNGVYVTPSVGYSLRTTTNSLFEVKVGYTASNSILKKDSETGDPSTRNNTRTTTTSTYGRMPISGLYASVSYTHTFKWGQNWRKKH